MNATPPDSRLSDLDADRLVTQGILNYISASLQGEFAELNALALLKSDKFNEGSLTNTLRGLDRLTTWLAATIAGDCIFSARTTEIESFDGQSAIEMAKRIREGLVTDIERLWEFSKRTTPPETAELLEILGLAVNSAYARDAYVRGFIEFGKRGGFMGMVQQYAMLTAESSYQVDLINDLLYQSQKSLAEKEVVAPELLPSLYAITRNTIVMLRSQLHDLRQIIARFEGVFDYQTAGFSREASLAWQERNLNAVAAGYWNAYEFTPEQAVRWSDVGIGNAQLAATWRGLAFSVDDAAPWHKKGISPFIAARFRRAGYNPDETIASLERGDLNPVNRAQAA